MSFRSGVPLFFALLAIVGVVETCFGRRFWSSRDSQCTIDGDVNANPSSLCCGDVWSPSHIVHGLVLYLVFMFHMEKKIVETGNAKVSTDNDVSNSKDLSPGTWKSLGCTLLIEALWEMIENHNYIILRFRDNGYYGDSVINSFSDIICCLLGWILAHHLKTHHTIALIVAMEATCYQMFGQNMLSVFFTLVTNK